MTNTTGSHNFVGIGEVFNHDPRSLILNIRQQPKRAKVSGVKDKIGEKPIDPPPIVQVKTEDGVLQDALLQNPSLFMVASLIGPADVMEESIPPYAVNGSLSSSLHKLKDIDNSDGGFFIFPEISVRIEGDYRLRFRLYEISSNQAILLKCIDSEIFRVYSAKFFPGRDESTFLSRSFADQGARIRIRRTSKIASKGYDTRTQTPTKRRSSFDNLPSKYFCSRSPDPEYGLDDSSDRVRLWHNNPTRVLNEKLSSNVSNLVSNLNTNTCDGWIVRSTRPTSTPTPLQLALLSDRTGEAARHVDSYWIKSKNEKAEVFTCEPYGKRHNRDGQFFGSLFESYLARNDIPLSNRNIESQGHLSITNAF